MVVVLYARVRASTCGLWAIQIVCGGPLKHTDTQPHFPIFIYPDGDERRKRYYTHTHTKKKKKKKTITNERECND